MKKVLTARPLARRRLDRRLLGLGLVVLVALCACDVRRSDTEPIAECMDYATQAKACLGDRLATRLRATFAKPPSDPASRTAARDQCIESATRLRRTCR